MASTDRPDPEPRPWTHFGSRVAWTGALFDVLRVQARRAGDERVHDIVRLATPDWVNVVPLTAAGALVMVRQFRHGSGTMTLEIPGGTIDPGEAPEEAGRRELLEETGYAGGAWTELGAVHPNPAIFTNRCFTYLARDVDVVAPIRNEGAEETVVVHVPLDEVPARIRAGEITHALVLAALHWHGLFEGDGAPQARGSEARNG